MRASETVWPILHSEMQIQKVLCLSFSNSASRRLAGASCELVPEGYEMAGTSRIATRHSLAYRVYKEYKELWSMYTTRQSFLKALESNVLSFLACHLSTIAFNDGPGRHPPPTPPEVAEDISGAKRARFSRSSGLKPSGRVPS